jgi:ribosomal protein S18 acetylase RimI-like enzyme
VTAHDPVRGASQPGPPADAPRFPEHPVRTPRPARPGDVPEILRLVRELAEYERSLAEVTATEELLHELLFGGNTPSGSPAAHCHVIEGDPGADGSDAQLAGMALWFLNASTWLGRHGIYLEDLYVRPQYRGRGYGQALMATLAAICVERGYARLEWWVLDWNTPAIGFYESLGARAMDEWTVHRLTGEALRRLGTTALESRGTRGSGAMP